MIKGSFNQEDITTVNIYMHSILEYLIQKTYITDMKDEADNNAITVGDFIIPLYNG